LKSRVSQAISAFAIVSSQALVSAHAFTLGDLRGAAVIGRPLDVSVLIQTREGEEANTSCIRADVFHADTPQANPRVSVTPGRNSGQQTLVRIESSAYVDEPVVTVLLHASCGSTTQRRYVLLADFPAVSGVPIESVPVAPIVPLVQAPAEVPQGAQAGLTGASDIAAVTPKSTSVAKTRSLTQPKQRKKGVASAPRARPASAKPAASAKRPTAISPRVAGQAVLKLDPLEVLSDRVDTADSYMDFSPAEDALRYSRQIASLDSELKALRAQSASNEKLLLDLRAKLQQAEQSQMPSGLLYALLAALAASLMLALWLWRARQADKQAEPGWWHSVAQVPGVTVGEMDPTKTQPTNLAQAAADAALDAAPQSVVVPGSAKATPIVPQKVPSALPMPDASGLDVDLDLAFSAPMPLDGEDNATTNVPYETNSIRHISMDPILDARQQAEFFVSLGQTDRALAILKKLIAETTEPNPLLYLDLITLYHSLGMKADFREQRDVFHRLFNGVVPDFPAYNLPGRDLESYPEVVSVLMRLWPRMDALAFLSACIFHDEQRQSRQTYDLTAFKDLLMLHTLADAVVDQTSPAYQSTSHLEFDENGVARLIEETDRPIVTRSLDLDFSAMEADRPQPEAHLAPDIDLDDTLPTPGKKMR
jgi:hypothetical protein